MWDKKTEILIRHKRMGILRSTSSPIWRKSLYVCLMTIECPNFTEIFWNDFVLAFTANGHVTDIVHYIFIVCFVLFTLPFAMLWTAINKAINSQKYQIFLKKSFKIFFLFLKDAVDCANCLGYQIPYARHYNPRFVFFYPLFTLKSGLYYKQFMD